MGLLFAALLLLISCGGVHTFNPSGSRASLRRDGSPSHRGARRAVAVASQPTTASTRSRSPNAESTRDSCCVYPKWPAVPTLEDADDPQAVFRRLVAQLLSVPIPVMGQTNTYDFLENGERETGLVEWREQAWAWRNFVGANLLAPYDELDAAARKSAAVDGLCKLSASTEPVAAMRATLIAIEQLCNGARDRYPKLYPVLKFVPKKNGLNPILAKLATGDTDLGLDSMEPREFEHLNRDVRRTFNQVFLLVVSYVTLPRELANEMLWCARFVVEKVKTDQRTRALEVVTEGAFSHVSPLFEMLQCVSLRGALEAETDESSFMSSYSPDSAAFKALERMRMVYPYLQLSYLASQALDSPERGELSSASTATAQAHWPSAVTTASAEAAVTLDQAMATARASLSLAADRVEPQQEGAWDVSGVPLLLRTLTEANPEEKVINSLLYWLLDLTYKRALTSYASLQLQRTQFILVDPESRPQFYAAFADVGRHVGTLVAAARAGSSGRELLDMVKVLEAQTTLMQSLRDSCAKGLWTGELLASVKTLLIEHDALLTVAATDRLPSLPASLIEAAGFGALGLLLEAPRDAIAARRHEVTEAMLEWRNPELLFRYYQDNLSDREMAPIVNRWLRAIFGTSTEALRDIRRLDPANLRHLRSIDQEVLQRWYDKKCPGTASMRTLFMVGEDAGSCLRVIGTLKNKFNRALMGYCLQSHVRVLVVFDSVKRVLARSVIRLLVRSDSREPVIYCDALFFTSGYSAELWRDIMAQAAALGKHMQIPVVHACSTLPVVAINESAGGYVREVHQLGYHVFWVDLLEIDGVSPYTYSEDLPWDEMLDQHTPGLQHRTSEKPTIVISALPRADSPSAAEYLDELRGKTTWTKAPDDELLQPARPGHGQL